MSGTHSMDFDCFIIESPTGKKVTILPINAYTPDVCRGNSPNSQFGNWYGQVIDAFAELNECAVFIQCKFNPAEAMKLLKSKGYKIYWQKTSDCENKKEG